jgi:nanoRNase/pAp phosphatase (c-di-AMP/oligoRNAs hydrolase)
MSNAANTADYTISADAQTVKVADFRNAIERLERIVRVDFHACVDADERAQWVERAKRAGRELIATTCKRANHNDWMRRERAIDASTDRIGEVLHG